MVDAPEEGGVSSIAEGPATGDLGGAGETPVAQVPSIDTLLGDIYELRYQLVQANLRMYRYREERDRYLQERDEAHNSLKRAQVHQLGASSTSRGNDSSVFIRGLCQQRDYYSGIVQTWLTGVLAFSPGVQYPLPPSSYMPINISTYQIGTSTQGTTRSRASPSRSATPWASPLGAVGSSELQGAQRPTSPIGSIGTTPPEQGTRGSGR